jgi:NADH-quinone oxidoreductase subunit L
MVEAAEPPRGLNLFLLEGWRFDALYGVLIVRPYCRLSEFFWQKVDEGCIDDSLDRTANLLGRCGQWIGGLGRGRVSLSLVSMAAAAALMGIWLAWTSL